METLSPKGSDQRNPLMPKSSINQKVFVGGADHRLGIQLSQSHEAGVSEVHWNIRIGIKQLGDGRPFVSQKHRPGTTLRNGLNYVPARNSLFRNQMADFCQHRLADNQQFSLWDEWDEWDEWRMLIRGMEHPKERTPNLPDQPK